MSRFRGKQLLAHWVWFQWLIRRLKSCFSFPHFPHAKNWQPLEQTQISETLSERDLLGTISWHVYFNLAFPIIRQHTEHPIVWAIIIHCVDGADSLLLCPSWSHLYSSLCISNAAGMWEGEGKRETASYAFSRFPLDPVDEKDGFLNPSLSCN